MSTESASAPLDFAETARRQKLDFWKRLSKTTVWFVVLPILIGVGATAFGMIRAFNRIGDEIPFDQEELSTNVATSLFITAIGLPVSLVGLLFLVFTFVQIRRLAR